MAISGTFQPSHFTFGDSIVKERMQKRQIQAEMERASQQAAMQARGQNIQRDQANANREEGARQFDARLAESEAARADAAAQRKAELAERGAAREESARQFDARMDEVERQRLDEREDKLHRQSWDDALNEQKLAGLQQEFDKRNVELERIMAIRQKEDEERAHQQELIESAYGDAVIAAELGGGFLSPGQIEDFNKRNNTDYNYVGKVDPTTGKPFEDGKLHFLTYQLDENGQVVMDEQSGRPMLTTDNPISAEFYGRVMDGYFGKFKGLMGRGSGKSGTRQTTGTPSARDMNAIAGTIERIGGMSPDMFEGGASEQKAFIKHLMQQTGFQFDGSAGGGGGGGLAVQPKNGSGAATVETGDETTLAPAGGSQQGSKPGQRATKEQIAAAKAAKEKLAARKRDQDWGATTLADGYTLGDEQQSEDEEGVSFRPVLDKDGNNVGAIYSDGFRSQLGEDGQYAEVPDDADASWQDEGRTTDELRRRFSANGGKENEDGSFSIDGDEYLSDDERAELGEGSSEGITRKHVRAQTQIAKRRAEVAQRRKAKEKLLRLDARKKFRGNAQKQEQKQEEWVERMLTAWDEKNDPSARRRAEAAAERGDFDWAHGHGMR